MEVSYPLWDPRRWVGRSWRQSPEARVELGRDLRNALRTGGGLYALYLLLAAVYGDEAA